MHRILILGTPAWVALTIFVVLYFLYTFGLGGTIDFRQELAERAGYEIPPEGYPMLLILLWSIASRVHARVVGTFSTKWRLFWRRNSRAVGLGMIGFGIFVFAVAMTRGTNESFQLAIYALLVASVADWVLNQEHLDTIGMPLGEQRETLEAGDAIVEVPFHFVAGVGGQIVHKVTRTVSAAPVHGKSGRFRTAPIPVTLP